MSRTRILRRASAIVAGGCLVALGAAPANATSAGYGWATDRRAFDGGVVGNPAPVEFIESPAETGSAASIIARSGPAPGTIPLPAAGWFLLAGLGGLAALRRRSSAGIQGTVRRLTPPAVPPSRRGRPASRRNR